MNIPMECPQKITIRRACPTDVVLIAEIWAQGQQAATIREKTQAEIEAFYLPYLRDQRQQFGIWLAVETQAGQEQVLGWQALLPCRPHPLFAHCFAQSSTYIHRDARSRGVGRLLLTYVTEQAGTHGLTHILGYVSVENAPSRHLVESLGWTLIGEVPSDAEGPLLLFSFVQRH